MTAFGLSSNPLFQTSNNFLQSFKIGVYLNAPLRPKSNTTSQILSLCAQLDTLQLTTYRNTGWNELVKEAQSLLSNVSSVENLPSSLTTLFPHLVPSTSHQFQDAFDDYLGQITILNQLYSLAHQLKHDVTHFINHKYIAHQIALLYQTLGQLGGPIGEYKKAIEARFDEIKSTTEQSKSPVLSHDQQTWLVNLTTQLIAEVKKSAYTLPKIQPLVEYARHN